MIFSILMASSCSVNKRLKVVEDARLCNNQKEVFYLLLSNEKILDRYGSSFTEERIFVDDEVVTGIPAYFLLNDTVNHIIDKSRNSETKMLEPNFISKCFINDISINQSEYQVYFWYDNNTKLMAIGTLLTLKEPGYNEGFIMLYNVESLPYLIDESFWIE